jgi:hypothetical protein
MFYVEEIVLGKEHGVTTPNSPWRKHLLLSDGVCI